MSCRIIVADVLDGLGSLESGGVQCCVTSPPYWGLRDYGTGSWEGGDEACSHRVGGQVADSKAPGAIVSGVRPGIDASTCRKCGARRIDRQIGLERTIGEYVEKLVQVFREVCRVLAPDGTLWLNLGDSYNAYNGNRGTGSPFAGSEAEQERPKLPKGYGLADPIIKPKDLVGMPWRVAFALQADGWWLRSDIVWSKPNPMPESVTDRPTKSHEYLFLMARSARYYYDQEAIAEPCSSGSRDGGKTPDGWDTSQGNGGHGSFHRAGREAGKPYRSGNLQRTPGQDRIDGASHVGRGFPWEDQNGRRNRRTVWTIATQPYPEAHFATFPEALVEPCVRAGSRAADTVLDPFCGSGTVGLVADRLGRGFVGIELNPTYAALAERRIRDACPMFTCTSVAELTDGDQK